MIYSLIFNIPTARKEGFRGIPSYEDASEKTRRRRNAALANTMSIDELCDTAKKKMKLHGNKTGAKLISKVFDLQSATEVMATLKNSQRVIMRKETPEEALEMMITCHLEKVPITRLDLRLEYMDMICIHHTNKYLFNKLISICNM